MNASARSDFFAHVAQTSDFPLALEIETAEGVWLYTTDGRRIMDFISGIAVSSLGHRHPKVVQAIKEQVDRHLHVMVYGEFIQKPQSALAGLMARNLPTKLQRIYFTNSGTEANEGALKLAKKFTGRTGLMGFHNSYHGDSHGALSVTGRAVYRDPFLPLLPEIRFGTFNDDAALDLIDETLAAVILEPIQGEGGIRPARKEWLKAVRQRCTEKGVLLIFDEIQSGFGRTGYFFAFEHYGVVPDILTCAKAMGGGLPLGAFISSDEIMATLKNDPPLAHVTTFGGHPVSCAAAHANLKELLEGRWMERAPAIESAVKTMLMVPGVREVRGYGAMLGMELESALLTEKVVNACLQEGLLLGWTLHSNTLVRLAPPLVISDDELEWALTTIVAQLQKVANQ
jgi:acetylornithine/succinyldiaminopimelate/putrescine aminotransferase